MPRLAGLDLLRSIAIVWVMLFHSFLVGGLGPGFEWLSRFGWAGVDIFFVLSGFLIGAPLLRVLQRGEALPLREFYWRRAWRIVPAFTVVLAVYLAFPALREVPGLAPWWQFASFTPAMARPPAPTPGSCAYAPGSGGWPDGGSTTGTLISNQNRLPSASRLSRRISPPIIRTS